MQKELVLPAKLENWEQVHSFLERCLEKEECAKKAKMQLLIAAEEIYVNIASYAYKDTAEQSPQNMVIVQIKKMEDTGQIVITFTDHGICYDPLKRETPDLTLSAEQRQIGGLGIHMVRKMMDEVEYRYEKGKNILTIKKTQP